MHRMTLVIAAALALAPLASAHAGGPDRWRDSIAEASHRFGIPEPWIRAVMQAESGGRIEINGRPITSPVGAVGLMQVTPSTYELMRRAHNLGPDPRDPRDNILAGTAYLWAMLARFGYPGGFAAYNAGPGRYQQSLHGRPLPAATRAYLASVTEGDTPGPGAAPRLIALSTATASPASPMSVPTTTLLSTESE